MYASLKNFNNAIAIPKYEQDDYSVHFIILKLENEIHSVLWFTNM